MNLRLLSRHAHATPFELASSDGQIPAVYQRALQLGKSKELATTLAERRLKVSRENFQHLYELLSLDSIAAVLYYALQFLFHVASIWTSTDS